MNLLESYLNFKRDIQEASEKTIKAYRNDLNTLLPILFKKSISDIEIEDLKTLEPIHVKTTLKDLAEKSKLTVTTINRKLSAVKDFYGFYANKHGFENVLKNMKKENDTRIKEYNYLSLDTMKELIEDAKHHSARDYYIMAVLFSTGLRSKELLDIKKEWISEDSIIVVGKRGKMRVVPLPEVAKKAISAYLAERGQHEGKMLDLSYSGLRFIYKNYCLKHGVQEAGKVHRSRHSFASNLVNNDINNLQAVSEILGHSNVSTTASFYLHSDKKKQVINSLGL